MFKETKAIAKQFVETAQEPIHTFDNMLKDDPELVIPLAIIHTVPVALMIIGTTQIIIGHQKLRAEKERTKQIRLKAMLHHGCRHHHGIKPHIHKLAKPEV